MNRIMPVINAVIAVNESVPPAKAWLRPQRSRHFRQVQIVIIIAASEANSLEEMIPAKTAWC
jgi:hypothetical protein